MLKQFIDTMLTGLEFMNDGMAYGIDSFQRSILLMDVFRERGNIYLEHLNNDQPPVLTFDYEIIMQGTEMAKPTNYNLAKIVPPEGITIDPNLRPVIIIDPRAGHGPGIGGSKRDSEIGMALKAGHPVYFVLFSTDPVPGQTIADVEKTEIAFIDEVIRRHPNSRKPSVTGNCQAGWALVMLSADRPGTTGPIVLNGSPLSYWAGLEGRDTMRYLGGLLGGVWMNSFLSDLGNGVFDGANLVMNFELLNLANTFWNKQYNVYSRVDTEAARYLNFEKWWNGYFHLTKEEIIFIVNNLFMGNKLEKGGLRLNGDLSLNLKNIKDPIVIFCSDGDNITPPQQALNWIVHVWGSVDEIKRHQQVIVYMLHKNIGHLGIFVSGKVAQKEHKEIIGSYDMIEYLPPGLYEMIIDREKEADIPSSDYLVRFEERQMEHILALDDGMVEEEEHFPLVEVVSRRNYRAYQTLASPLLRMIITEPIAKLLRQLHPMRTSRYMFSDINPLMLSLKPLANYIRNNRFKIPTANGFQVWEKNNAAFIAGSLDAYNQLRAGQAEIMFQSLYEASSPLNRFYPEVKRKKNYSKDILKELKERKAAEQKDRSRWLSAMTEGGFVEGLIRVVAAISSADGTLNREEFIRIQEITRTHDRLKNIPIAEFRRIAGEQTRILQTDPTMAVQTIARLLATEKDRKDVYEICQIVFKDNPMTESTKTLVKTLLDGMERLDRKEKKVAKPSSRKKSQAKMKSAPRKKGAPSITST